MGAADLAAVRPLGDPGTHTLDEDSAARLGEPDVVDRQGLIQIQVGEHVGMLAVEVLRGMMLAAAGGQDGGAVFDHDLAPLPIHGPQGGGEVA